MPKAGFLTPKAIGNRIKAKGLQKLRWYCQMCQKQCRDENGFKCHMTSESHQRQLLLVGENPEHFVDDFSRQFRKAFVDLLQRQYNGRRVAANVVYNDYISDKGHTRMNGTKWVTLTEFIHSLAADGLVKLEETPKGWFMTYLDQDPDAVQRREQMMRRAKHEKNEEQRQAEAIQAQIEKDREAAAARGEEYQEPEFTELQRDPDEKIVVSLAGVKPAAEAAAATAPSSDVSFAQQVLKQAGVSIVKPSAEDASTGQKRPLSNMELLKEQLEAKKLKAAAPKESNHGSGKTSDSGQRKDYWLYEGIIVKVINKTLKDGKYHKKKGVVEELVDKYTGKIRLLDSKTVLKLDQEFLETVIPAVGGTVLVVNGPYRGYQGTLLGLDIDNFCAQVRMDQGPHKGVEIPNLAYEDMCKLA